MVRAALVLVVLAGCDQLFQIEHVSASDGGAADGLGDAASHDDARQLPGPHYVQSSSATSVSGSVLQVVLPNPQNAGDLLVVFVGWTGMGTVANLADSRGDTFLTAVGATVGNNLGQAMFYAPNVNSGETNTVSITFTATTSDLDARVLEYTQMATIDVLGVGTSKAGSGTAQMSSDSLLVAESSVLVAGFMSNETVTTPGTGFAGRITTTAGNYAEDRDISAEGSYVADATQSNTGAFIVHVAAFAAQ
jgi:hypothetical protein